MGSMVVLGGDVGSICNLQMRKILKILCLFVACVCGGACAEDSKMLEPPFGVPVNLGLTGFVVDREIRISNHFVYEYSLRFAFKENDQADRKRVLDLLGGYPQHGADKSPRLVGSTPIVLTITRLEEGVEKHVYAKDVDPALSSWGGDSFAKNIGFCDLIPGIYRVRLLNKKGSPEFDSTNVRFVMGFDKYKFNQNRADWSKSCPQ